ncbi:MAG: hypothetical protein ACYC5K_08220 [Saccharofermentanales bacterium]
MKKFIVTISIALVMTLTCSQIAAFAMPDNNQADQESTMPRSEDSLLFEHTEADVNAKKAMEKNYASNFIQLSEHEISLRQNKIYTILNDGGIDDKTRFTLLEEIKVYLFIPSTETATLASEAANVSLAKPTVFYDSMLNRWIVSASGYWKSYSYLSGELDPPAWKWIIGFSVGDTWNVGGYEAAGIALTNTSGSSAGLLRTSGYGRLSSSGSQAVINSNSCTANDKYGAVFMMQDYSYVTSAYYYFGWQIQVRYIGYYFNAVVEYNSNFANWHGTAKLYYAHTWSTSSISSIGVSSSGASASWINENYTFDTHGLGTLY